MAPFPLIFHQFITISIPIMTLSDIKSYLSREGSASLAEIARHFNADRSLVESMLDRWILKGRVVARTSLAHGPGCCGKCSGESHVWYEWVGDGA
ncbi:FeoC-like transcriptional regulator [Pelodictyon luteolum]|nr:FeoC-like transcriptional regulator [Pelodictyon luteolum]